MPALAAGAMMVSSVQAGDAAQGSWELDNAARTERAEAPCGRDRQCGTDRADRDRRNRRYRIEAACQARERFCGGQDALEGNDPARAQRDRSYCSGKPMEAITVDQLTHTVIAQVNDDHVRSGKVVTSTDRRLA